MVALVRLLVAGEVELADLRVVAEEQDGLALDLHLRTAVRHHVADAGDDPFLLGLVVLGLLLVLLQRDLVAVRHEVRDGLVARVQRGLRARLDVRAAGAGPLLDLLAVRRTFDLLALVGTGLRLRLAHVEEPDQLFLGADGERGRRGVTHLGVGGVVADVLDQLDVELVLLVRRRIVRRVVRRIVLGGQLERRELLPWLRQCGGDGGRGVPQQRQHHHDDDSRD